MGVYLISIWLFGGAITLILARVPTRPGTAAPRANVISVGLFVLGVIAGAMSAVNGEPWASVGVWIALGCVNLALALMGWKGIAKPLAVLGAFATLGALVLIALHAFSSLPVMVAAGVLCLGAALIARSAHSTPGSLVQR
ncbi:MAG: hypothetical protein KGJ98_05005 [Chloroflexota bacterium]|nr:hypothetical protein [Chloroflexota bacterium]